MQPVDFEGSNILMDKPNDMTDEQCASGVPAYIGVDADGNKYTLLLFHAFL